MNLKNLITRVAAIGVFTGMAFAADKPLVIKLGTLAPDGSAAHKALLQMGDQWSKLSGAAVQLKVYTGGNQGTEADILDRIGQHELQAALLTTAGIELIDPAANALQNMPGTFRSFEEMDYVREKLRPLLDQRLAAKGMTPLFWGDTGWVRIFSTKPVVHPDDLKKLKLFVLAGEDKELTMMRNAGFQPIPYQYTNTYTGLATGQIESVPTIPIFAQSGGFAKYTKYMLNLNYVPLAGALVIDSSVWNRMPQAIRDALRRIAEDTGKRIMADGRKEMAQAVAALERPPTKVHVTPMTPALEQEWRKLFESLPVRGDLVPPDVYDEVQKLLREYRK